MSVSLVLGRSSTGEVPAVSASSSETAGASIPIGHLPHIAPAAAASSSRQVTVLSSPDDRLREKLERWVYHLCAVFKIESGVDGADQVSLEKTLILKVRTVFQNHVKDLAQLDGISPEQAAPLRAAAQQTSQVQLGAFFTKTHPEMCKKLCKVCDEVFTPPASKK